MQYVQGILFGGQVAAQGTLVPRSLGDYEARALGKGIDLAQLSQAFNMTTKDGKPRASGDVSIRIWVSGELPISGSADAALDSLLARGRVRISNGDLWSTNVLSGIISNIPVARGALTRLCAGMAAGGCASGGNAGCPINPHQFDSMSSLGSCPHNTSNPLWISMDNSGEEATMVGCGA
jgi:hypothetical protein